MYVRGLIFFLLMFTVGCSSQSSDDENQGGSTAPASLSITPSTYDFDYVPNGTRVSNTFIITNSGGFNASNFSHVGSSGPFRFKGLSYPGTGGSCPTVVPNNSSCSVVIEFAPTTLNDDFNETMQIQYLDGTSLQILPLSLQGRSLIPAIAPTSLTLQNPVSSPNTDNTPTINVSGGDVGPSQTIKLYTDSACTQLVGSSVSTGNNVNVTSSTLADGTYNFYATTTNSFAGISPCSTATVAYEVDTTAPNPQTIITHSPTHNNVTTSPAISWTRSTSTDVATQSIGLSTNPAGGNNIAGFDTLNSAISNHTFNGQNLNECTDYYATLFATDDVGLTSIYAVSATPFQIDANNPTNPSNLSLSGIPTLVKTPTLNFSASTDTCGIDSYEVAIGTTNNGTGVNNTLDWLNVGNISGSYLIEKNKDGANFDLDPNGTYYISIRSKDSFGKYSNITTSAPFTVNPTFNLSSTNEFQDKVDLTWTAPITTGITDYSIFYKLSTSSTYTLFNDSVSTNTTTTLTGLTPGSDYDIYVKAKVGPTFVEFSNTVNVTTDSPLLPPTNLVLLNPNSSPGNDASPEITASGGDVTNGNTIKLYSDNACTALVATATAAGTSVNLTVSPDLPADGPYTFYATVTDPDLYVSTCSTVSVNYELDTVNPDPITSITHIDSHNDTSTSPIINWTLSASTDVANQYIGLSANAVGGNDITGWEPLNNTLTNYTFSGLALTQCTDHYVTVYTEDSASNVSSYAVSATPFQVDAPPSDPTGLSLSGTPTLIKTPTLNFIAANDTCGIDNYEIALGTTNSGAGINDTQDWITIGNPAGSYTLENGIDSAAFNLVPGGTYYISLRAKDIAGNYSSEVTSASFTVNDTFILSLTTAHSDKLDLTWTAPLTAGITDYEVFFKLSSDTNYSTFADGVSTATSTSLTGLNADSSYDIYIMAKNGSTYFEYSNTLTQSTEALALAPPISLILKDPTTNPNADTTPVITVNLAVPSTGGNVRMYSDSACTTQVSSTYANNGVTSVDLNVFTPLPLGSHTFYATMSDNLGTTSACSTASLTYEVIVLAIDPPISLTLKDPLTSPNPDTTPVITVGLASPSTGGNVRMYSDSACTTQVSSTYANNGVTSVDLNVYTPLAPGVHNFYATMSDNQGTTSACSTATVEYEIGAGSLDPPISLTLKDPLTSPNPDTTPVITVGLASPSTGGNVKMYTDSACTTEVSNTYANNGVTSVDLNVYTPLAPGVHNFYATMSDNQGTTSACSTATVEYEVGLDVPDPPTNVTHLESHDNTTTSPPISWTLSTSANVSQQFIGLSTLPAGGNDEAGFQSLSATATTHTFNGLSLTECTNYYATVYARNNSNNDSPYAVSSLPFSVDANDPTAVTGESLSGTATLVKTPSFNWTGDSTDTCGVDYYEIALGTSDTGAGVNNTIDWTNIGTPANSYSIEDGTDGISLSLVPGTTYYISLRAVDVNGNISVITTSVGFDAQPTFILGLDERLADSLKISWTAPLTSGVTDYDIFYKLTTDLNYIQFVDGTSIDRNAEITGLTPSTEYDIYVQAKVGTNTVEASNTISESTGPSQPFFTANYAAANVGGATGCRVIAYDGGGTEIKKNGANFITLANAGDTHEFSCAPHDLLESDKPFYVNGARGSANISWASKAFSGKEYVFDFTRSSPQRLHLFAFEAANIEVYRGTTLITSTVLAANTGTINPINITTFGSYKIISDGLIIAFKDGAVNLDPMLLSPVNQEVIGFPSNAGRLGVFGTGINVTSALATGTPTTNSYNEGTSYSFAGTGSFYSGSALKLTAAAGNKIGANSYADSNGSCSASFASTSKFFTRYILPGDSEWVAIAATEAMTIEVVNAATGTVESTFALTGNAANGVYYGRTTNVTTGRIYRAVDTTKKFAMWWEPKSTTSYMINDDETIMWGSDD